eukprot:9908382-Lingulodinium_polyedra.AAC.1
MTCPASPPEGSGPDGTDLCSRTSERPGTDWPKGMGAKPSCRGAPSALLLGGALLAPHPPLKPDRPAGGS